MLKTERLVLRGPSLDDVDDLFAVYGDPRVMRYWSEPPHADRSVTETMVKRHIAAFDHAPLYFVIEHKGRAIGRGGVHDGDEVGFILGADYWQQGLMTEALFAMIDHFFEDLRFPQLTADADPRNAASVATLQKVGFVQTGEAKNTFCVNGEWSDSAYFTLKAPREAA
ncbi:ribosomal-protein-alanine N-acetyltransferase [Marivita hallyeonensis]|uniref:Ribosomal-protein-alanine N-acetyltransferase n=1 Tax=Marivita hallyeonensis TaxID=996342 RepID=A0A1M5VTD1_9RHOB|nr:ribosomal-protein-alanine N-acetyltransferase [Marivita hallyeonensis]